MANHQIKADYQEKIIKIISIFFPDATIYLFGSRAKQTHTESSDIDIAIDIGHPMPITPRAQIVSMIDVLGIPQEVDVVDLRTVPEAMRNAILKEGIVWKDSNKNIPS
jgi:predicted nucleotidyltransferase